MFVPGTLNAAYGCHDGFDIVVCLQILKPSEKKTKYQYSGLNSGRPITPPRAGAPGAPGPVAGSGAGSAAAGTTPKPKKPL